MREQKRELDRSVRKLEREQVEASFNDLRCVLLCIIIIFIFVFE